MSRWCYACVMLVFSQCRVGLMFVFCLCLVTIGWFMVVGCWLLVVGCWLLVAGCWLLVVGCWLLVVSQSR